MLDFITTLVILAGIVYSARFTLKRIEKLSEDNRNLEIKIDKIDKRLNDGVNLVLTAKYPPSYEQNKPKVDPTYH